MLTARCAFGWEAFYKKYMLSAGTMTRQVWCAKLTRPFLCVMLQRPVKISLNSAMDQSVRHWLTWNNSNGLKITLGCTRVIDTSSKKKVYFSPNSIAPQNTIKHEHVWSNNEHFSLFAHPWKWTSAARTFSPNAFTCIGKTVVLVAVSLGELLSLRSPCVLLQLASKFHQTCFHQPRHWTLFKIATLSTQILTHGGQRAHALETAVIDVFYSKHAFGTPALPLDWHAHPTG